MSWSFCGHGPTASPPKGTGVLWVLTRTHPCGTSTQEGWWRYQSDSSCERGHAWWCCRTRGRVCCRWFCGEVLSPQENEKCLKPEEKCVWVQHVIRSKTALALNVRRRTFRCVLFRAFTVKILHFPCISRFDLFSQKSCPNCCSLLTFGPLCAFRDFSR